VPTWAPYQSCIIRPPAGRAGGQHVSHTPAGRRTLDHRRSVTAVLGFAAIQTPNNSLNECEATNKSNDTV